VGLWIVDVAENFSRRLPLYDRKVGPRAGRMMDCELDPSASACRRFAFFIRAE
jgi:hypothetical protein